MLTTSLQPPFYPHTSSDKILEDPFLEEITHSRATADTDLTVFDEKKQQTKTIGLHIVLQ